MFKVQSGDESFTISFAGHDKRSGTVNDQKFEWDTVRIAAGELHIIRNNRSYNVQVLKADYVEKLFVIRVNGNTYDLHVQDRFDALLEQMGMSNLAVTKITEVKAPMPGLVLEVIAKAGATVKKGDPILVLEAMKMENVIKSPADGVVKAVPVEQGKAVEKGQVLLEFE